MIWLCVAVILYCAYRFARTKERFYLLVAAFNAALLIAGCSSREPDPYFAELERQCRVVCEDHGGVMNVCSIVQPSCTCKDGARFD